MYIFSPFSPISISTGCPQAVMTKVKVSFFRSAAVIAKMKTLKTPLFTTVTVDELLWGYEDSLLAFAATRDATVDKVFGLMYKARQFFFTQQNKSEPKSTVGTFRPDLALCVRVCSEKRE